MKIRDIVIWRLRGHAEETEWPRPVARSVGPLDRYDEFRSRGPQRRRDVGGPVEVAHYYVEILTDDGPSGLHGPVFEQQGFLIDRMLRPLLLGRDALAGETLWDLMFHCDRHARAGSVLMAVSSVDCALWDLRGKVAGLPVWRLLGGSRSRVRAYASLLGASVEPEAAAQEARRQQEAGFAAQKWFFRHGPAEGPAGRRANLDLAHAVREAVGDGGDVMFDCWMGWDLPYATAMARELAGIRPRWLEEPLEPNEWSAYARLRAASPVPIAAGEHHYTRWDARELLERGCVDVLQADPEWTGGISELLRICSVAETCGVPVIPHGHNLHPAMHVVAARNPRTCPMVEYLLGHLPKQQFFHRVTVRPVDGWIALPELPGLGVELDEGRIDERQRMTWR